MRHRRPPRARRTLQQLPPSPSASERDSAAIRFIPRPRGRAGAGRGGAGAGAGAGRGGAGAGRGGAVQGAGELTWGRAAACLAAGRAAGR